MKKELFYLPVILILEILLTCCSKTKDTIKEPQPEGKNFLYKIIEYQTNIPIYAAKLEFSYCVPLEWGGGACSSIRTVGTWFSDIKGEILIKPGDVRGSFNLSAFSKDTYWSKSNLDTVISSATQDSAVVRLFPYSWVKIHLKNEINHANSVNINMNLNVDLDNSRGNYSPSQSFAHLANNLDTTVIYKTFGNIENIVEASLDSSGIMQQVYSKTEFINKNDTAYFEILLK